MTKLWQEHLGKIYALIHGLPVVTLRYFTVYGPRQRPDMAIYRFMNLIMEGKPLPVFGDGQQKRDFTYVEDVVRANCLAMERAVEGRAFDIGTGQPVTLLELIEAIEAVTGKKAAIKHLAAQPGEVRETRADLEDSAFYLGYVPQVELRTGLGLQWEWMCERRCTRLTR